MIKKQVPGSFFNVDVSRRTRKSKFFHPINAVIAWSVFEQELYKVCKHSIQDAAGRPAYTPSVLFKMLLLQTWYHLSEMGVEDMVNDTLSATFCG
jgi:IS5 family transposase